MRRDELISDLSTEIKDLVKTDRALEAEDIQQIREALDTALDNAEGVIDEDIENSEEEEAAS